jgi:hypothetical protein
MEQLPNCHPHHYSDPAYRMLHLGTEIPTKRCKEIEVQREQFQGSFEAPPNASRLGRALPVVAGGQP